MSNKHQIAFTLIELLVVVTIIVVLLALLTPAMDRAVYQAELVLCASQQKTVASAVTAYAFDNNRIYPHRPTARAPAVTAEQARYIYCIVQPDPAMGQGRDDRPYLRSYMSIQLLDDPMSGQIDLDSPPGDGGNWVISNYSIWYGVQYPLPNGGKWIRKLGDRLHWTDQSRGGVRSVQSEILISDLDAVYSAVTNVLSSHPEATSKAMTLLQVQSEESYNTVQTYSFWWTGTTANPNRNPVDLNYAYANGSVQRVNRVEYFDDQMARLPFRHNLDQGPYNAGQLYWHQLPLN